MSQPPHATLPSRRVLLITSHAHTPPLDPPADLKFNLRSLPNPSRSIRATSNGTHARLRTELMGSSLFVEELDRVEKAIKESIAKLREVEDSQQLEVGILSVSCFCDRGQHRSVAFVEELARKDWPGVLEVKIVHRDVGKKKSHDRNSRSNQGKDIARGSLGEELAEAW